MDILCVGVGHMEKKKASKLEKQQDKSEVIQGETNRGRKVMNLIANTSIILMSTLMGGFSEIMVNTMGTAVSGIAGAMGGEEAGEKVNQEFEQKRPEINEKIAKLISDARKDIYAQMGQKQEEIEPFLSDPVFDVGPKKVDEYDFNLPKLTEEIDDASLAQYTQLLLSEDANFSELFKTLGDWLNSLPKLPEKTNKE
jgi:DNA-binding transcriptional MerR regulator